MNGGFLEQRRRSPASLVAVAAAHAGVIAALMLSVSHFTQTREPITYLDSVPVAPPPPPTNDVVKPTQHQTTTTPTQITRTDPTLPTTTTNTVTTDPTPLSIPTVDGGAVGTGDPGPTPVTSPPPAPVFVDAAMDPRYAGDLQPPYPPQLERTGTEGVATVRVLVGPDGRVTQVEPVSADDPAFFAATQRQALRHWRFKPATRDGQPVESWKTMTVRFTLRDS